jgi:hypothetical protein
MVIMMITAASRPVTAFVPVQIRLVTPISMRRPLWVTLADPNDRGMMDVVGVDTTVPAVISDFVRAERTVQGCHGGGSKAGGGKRFRPYFDFQI